MLRTRNRSSLQHSQPPCRRPPPFRAAPLVALLLSTLVLSMAAGATPMPGRNTTAGTFRSSPVMFIENAGQFDNRARFQVRDGPGTMWLVEDAIWVTVLERPDKATRERGDKETISPSPPHLVSPSPRRGVNLRLTFPGANPHPRIEPFDRLDTVVSYFIGNNPDRWRPDVPVWVGVRYVDLYPGVDLEVTDSGGRWAWRLVCRANCQFALQDVRLRVEGAEALAVDSDVLRLTTAVGDFTLPLLTVEDSTLQVERSNVEHVNTHTFEATSPFISTDPTGISGDALSLLKGRRRRPELVEGSAVALQDNIDDLLYSTFLGGSGSDDGYDIAVDGMGNAYVTGGTQSSDFPTTPGAFDTTHNGGDSFVIKLNASGTGLAYATFLGGSGDDGGGSIAVDAAGSAYVTGGTSSSDFPTTAGAFDTSHNGEDDAFVVKLNAGGTGLTFATLVGGSSGEQGYAVAIDSAGTVYVTGHTSSSNFPTTSGAFDTSHNGDFDAFAIKLNAAGTELAYATFLGGSDFDHGYAIAVDGAGSAYVHGTTRSADFPTTPGAFDTSFNGGWWDAFVVKLNASGAGLGYATFLGGSNLENGIAIAVDRAGSAYMTGETASSDFPTTAGAFDFNYNGGSYDAFVVKLNVGGTALTHATFLGGRNWDSGRAILVDETDSAYVVGWTESSDFPTTTEAFDTSYNGNSDAFVVKVNAGGTDLTYATFLGGTNSDCHNRVCAIAMDGAGKVLVAGTTESSDFPTTVGAFDTSHNGSRDAFVAKLAVGEPTPAPTPTSTATATRTPTPQGTSPRSEAYLPLIRRSRASTPTPAVCDAGFENGSTFASCWSHGGELPARPVTQLYNGDPPHTGQYSALLGNSDWGVGWPDPIPAGSAWIEQRIQVPNTSNPRLTFFYRIASYDVMQGTRLWDTLDITINGTPNVVFRDGPDRPPANQGTLYDGGWKLAAVDLGAWRGQEVVLRFAVWNREYDPRDGTDYYNTWAYLDQVSVEP